MSSWIYKITWCHEERTARRAALKQAEWERQMKALEHLVKMGVDPKKMWAPQPWSLKKPRGFRLAAPSKYFPHQGGREKTRRMRQMGAVWA